MKDRKKKAPLKEETQPIRYYSLTEILKRNAHYNVIFGERSNGKTYAVLLYALKKFVDTGEQFAYVRRFEEDIRGSRGDSIFDALNVNHEVEKLTKGKYTFIRHKNRVFYLGYHDNTLDKDILDTRPFAYSFSVNIASRYKSTSYPGITTICYDEFLERSFYLPNEFADFMSIISTIVRTRDNVKIFMLGNTVNKTCPYFVEMGLSHIKDMQQGAIDVYQYGKSKLRVAVEYAANLNKDKPSNVYFAFDNPRLQMITGGVWEMARYPHLPIKYTPNQIILTYFIVFDDNILQCEIVDTGDSTFTYIHRKTTPIQDLDNDIIYSLEYDQRPNHVRRLSKPVTKWQRMIADYFVADKVFYQDNEIGEIVRNYIITSANDKIR